VTNFLLARRGYQGGEAVSCTGTRLRQSDQTGAGTPKCDKQVGHTLRVTHGLSGPSRTLPPIPFAARCERPQRARITPVAISDTHKQTV
jgi:hypothetical protein